MSLFHFGVEAFVIPGAHGVDEVGEVVAAFRPPRPFFAIFAK